MHSSKVSHQHRQLSIGEYQSIVTIDLIQKDNVYTVNRNLKPTNHYERVQGKNYFILDAEERMGNPVTEKEMKSRIEENKR